MKTQKTDPVSTEFDAGESAAMVILEEIGVTHRWVKKGIQLRFGERGRLTTPEPDLACAIMALIFDGPHSRTQDVLIELFLAGALALTDEPEADVFGYTDVVLDRATCQEVTEETPSTKAGIVLSFPSKRIRTNE